MKGYDKDAMLIEGVVTTVSSDGVVNVAPMGPIVSPRGDAFLFRPFKTSTTYRNFKASGVGVFHLVDDVLLIARAAIGRVEARKVKRPAGVGDRAVMTRVDARTFSVDGFAAREVAGVVLCGACRWHELRVTKLEDDQDRTHIEAKSVHVERGRDWAGFNRARHAVIEAAILATRLHLTGKQPVLAELDRLQIAVDKTGASAEHEAFGEVRSYVEAWTETET